MDHDQQKHWRLIVLYFQALYINPLKNQLLNPLTYVMLPSIYFHILEIMEISIDSFFQYI